jgi:hypothetical protein
LLKRANCLIENAHRRARPALAKAIEACRAFNAKLVIAKLDRLSRDAHFLLGLEKAGIEFVAVDMRHANRLTVGIIGAGRRAGAHGDLRAHQSCAGGGEGARRRARQAEGLSGAEFRCWPRAWPRGDCCERRRLAERLRPVLAELALLSANAAAEFDRRGYTTARGGKWTAGGVINLRARLQG